MSRIRLMQIMAPSRQMTYLARMSKPQSTDDPANPAAQAEPDWVDVTEQRLLDAALILLAEHGRWDAALVAKAGAEIGLSAAETELLVPNGARDLAALLIRRHDAAAAKTLAQVDATSLKIRERIYHAVAERIEAAMADDLAVRKASVFLASPGNAGLLGRLLWATADMIWRWAGDTAVDFNHYSKRAILSGVIASTLGVRLAQGEDAARRHLTRSIDAVMQFEKFKARTKFDPEGLARTVAGVAARFRYGAPVQDAPAPEADLSPGTAP